MTVNQKPIEKEWVCFGWQKYIPIHESWLSLVNESSESVYVFICMNIQLDQYSNEIFNGTFQGCKGYLLNFIVLTLKSNIDLKTFLKFENRCLQYHNLKIFVKWKPFIKWLFE